MLDGWIAYLVAIPFALAILFLGLGRFRTLVAMVAVAHLAVLASVALFPLPVSPEAVAHERAEAGVGHERSLDLVPLATIGPVLAGRTPKEDRELAVLNLLVLAPAGVYLPLLFPRTRRWRAFVPIALLGGMSVEVAQFVISLALGFRYRSITADDAILNTAGLVIGWLALRIALAAADRAAQRSLDGAHGRNDR